MSTENNYGHTYLPHFDIIEKEISEQTSVSRVFALTTSGVMVEKQPVIHSSI